MEQAEAWQRLGQFVDTQSTLVLATAGADGKAQGAPLFYLPEEGMRLFWLSSPKSRHSRAIAVDPQVALSIHGQTWRWDEIRGAQFEGTVGIVDDPAERDRLLARYRERFSLDDSFGQRMAASHLYRFRPRWVRYLENGAGGLFRWEFDRAEIEARPR